MVLDAGDCRFFGEQVRGEALANVRRWLPSGPRTEIMLTELRAVLSELSAETEEEAPAEPITGEEISAREEQIHALSTGA